MITLWMLFFAVNFIISGGLYIKPSIDTLFSGSVISDINGFCSSFGIKPADHLGSLGIIALDMSSESLQATQAACFKVPKSVTVAKVKMEEAGLQQKNKEKIIKYNIKNT